MKKTMVEAGQLTKAVANHLRPVPKGDHDARRANGEAAIQHMRAIEAACSKGDLRLFTPNLVPTSKVEYGTLIRRDDAQSYLESIGLPQNLLDRVAHEQQPEETLNEQIYRLKNAGKHYHQIVHELGVLGQYSSMESATESLRQKYERQRKKQPKK
jgi:hypothetical protein